MSKLGVLFLVIVVVGVFFFYITHRSVEQPKSASDVALLEELRQREQNPQPTTPATLPTDNRNEDEDKEEPSTTPDKVIEVTPDTLPTSDEEVGASDISEVSQEQPAEQEEPELLVIRQGRFNPNAADSDAIHRGWGSVMIVRYDGYTRLITGEDFRVTNGPDYYVYLVPGVNVETEEQFNALKSQSVNLGRMRQFRGYQTYLLPEDLDLTGLDSVVIWCERFSQFISVADIRGR